MEKEELLILRRDERSEGYRIVTEEEGVVVCPVCGYANRAHTALCKMCSNYLFETDEKEARSMKDGK